LKEDEIAYNTEAESLFHDDESMLEMDGIDDQQQQQQRQQGEMAAAGSVAAEGIRRRATTLDSLTENDEGYVDVANIPIASIRTFRRAFLFLLTWILTAQLNQPKPERAGSLHLDNNSASSFLSRSKSSSSKVVMAGKAPSSPVVGTPPSPMINSLQNSQALGTPRSASPDLLGPSRLSAMTMPVRTRNFYSKDNQNGL